MTRPAVGAPLRRCTECGDYEYGGAPACDTCRALVDWIVEEEWSLFLRHWNVDAERDQDQAQERRSPKWWPPNPTSTTGASSTPPTIA